MNKKFSLLIVLLVMIEVAPLTARTIDADVALDIASHFAVQRASAPGRRGMTAVTTLELAHTSIGYYAFNYTEGQGFVLVATDDRMHTVLGYSDVGSFDISSVPDGMRYWLENCDCVASALAEDTGVGTLTAASLLTDPGTPVVGPLVTTRWSQSDPYNLLCTEVGSAVGYPSSRCVTGCVATAVAQVMNYHKWPTAGTGSNAYSYAYNINSQKYLVGFSSQFDAHTYDWKHMRDTYVTDEYTDVEAAAVALLMHDVGIACKMQYNSGSSAAYSEDAARALRGYFGYSQTADYVRRKNYSDAEWLALLQGELDNNRPVVCDGGNSSGGHAFVFDGYDSNNYFHVNWGWGGHCDGWYLCDALDPVDAGTGANAGNSYNEGQGAIIGIQPRSAGEEPESVTHKMWQDADFNYVNGSETSFQPIICASAEDTFTFYFCFEDMTSPGAPLYQNLGYVSISTVDTNNKITASTTCTLALPDGCYRVYPAYQCNRDVMPTYHRLRSEAGHAEATYVTVTDGVWTVKEQPVVDGIRYLTDADSATVTGNGYEDDINIPATVSDGGADYAVKAVDALAFSSASNLASVTLHRNPLMEGVTMANSATTLALLLTDADHTDHAPYANHYDQVTLTRTLTPDVCSTLCLPFDPDATTLATCRFYAFSNIDGEQLTFTEILNPQAGVPYLCMPRSGETVDAFTASDVTLTAAGPQACVQGNWTFHGALQGTVFTGNWDTPVYYGVSTNNTIVGAKKKLTVYPYRAYLHCEDGSSSRSINLRNDDGTTRILPLDYDMTDASSVDGGMTDLYGRPVSHPTSGIYIVDGKKVFIR